MSTIVLGLTGKNASGKGTVAEVLKEHGFVYHSLSDSLRDELNLLGKKETRENLIEIGTAIIMLKCVCGCAAANARRGVISCLYNVYCRV